MRNAERLPAFGRRRIAGVQPRPPRRMCISARIAPDRRRMTCPLFTAVKRVGIVIRHAQSLTVHLIVGGNAAIGVRVARETELSTSVSADTLLDLTIL